MKRKPWIAVAILSPIAVLVTIVSSPRGGSSADSGSAGSDVAEEQSPHPSSAAPAASKLRTQLIVPDKRDEVIELILADESRSARETALAAYAAPAPR